MLLVAWLYLHFYLMVTHLCPIYLTLYTCNKVKAFLMRYCANSHSNGTVHVRIQIGGGGAGIILVFGSTH